MCCLAFQNEYMKDDFMIKIETWHKPDMGTIENVSEQRACWCLYDPLLRKPKD